MKTILMIGGGVQEVPAAISIKSAGYNLAVSDKNTDAPCREHADYFLNFNGEDVAGITKFIKKNNKALNIRGILTLTELVSSVSQISENLGLQCASSKSANFCQDKSISKQIWLDNKISTPYGKVAENSTQAFQIFNDLSKDVFVKPLVGFGGIGAKRISGEENFSSFISETDLSNYLIEEVCEGKMIDVNGYFDTNKKFHPLGCFEREFSNDAIIESLGIYPCQDSSDIINEAYNLTEAACRSLGISWGPVKSDLIVTKNGIKVFEVAPRLHGPKGTLYLTSLVHKKNHLEMILPLIVGEQPNISDNFDPNKIAGFCLIESPEKPFSKISNLEKLSNLGYESLIFKKRSSSAIHYSSSSDVIGYIFASADSKLELLNKLQKVNGIIDFKNTL